MLRTMSSLIASKLVPTSEGIIKGFGDGNVIDEASVVGKTNTRS